MYKSVTEYFETEYPNLVASLENGGAFWPKVNDNTISNATLDQVSQIGESVSRVNQACYAMMRGRLTEKIPNPG